MIKFFTLTNFILFLAGCTTTPWSMDASHPASPTAPEASTPPARATLQPDATTLRTRELLATRERETKAAESEKPVGGDGMEGHEHE